MSTVRKEKYHSVEEYLEMEVHAEARHEYYDGEIFAMAGGTRNHNLIISNCVFSLKSGLKGRGCSVYGDGMKLQIETENAFVYPDVHVHCGPPEFYPDRKDVIINSSVVFEVLSESTASFDRGGKFERYKKNPTILEYVLVEQNEPHIDIYRRDKSGKWNNVSERYYGFEAIFKLQSLNVAIPLTEIYDLVEFPPQPD